VTNLDLEERVRMLEDRIEQLENKLERTRQSGGQPPAGWNPPSLAKPSDFETPHLPRAPKEPDPPIDWEHLIARVWLPRIFILILLLGVLWGFSAAISYGIITKPVRIILGFIASIFMLGMGERQYKHNRIVLGQVLLGGAIAVLMLTVFAAHALYDFIPFTLAFILYIIVIAAFIYLSIHHRSQTIHVLAVFGGYLVPFLMQSSQSNLWILCGYETSLSIAILLISLKYHYQITYYLSLAMLHLTLFVTFVIHDGFEHKLPFLMAILIQHLLLTLCFLNNKTFLAGLKAVLLSSFSLTAFWFFLLYHDEQLYVYQYLIGTAAALYTSLAAWATMKHKETKHVLMTVASFGWFLWFVSVLNLQDFTLAILVEGTLAFILGLRMNSILQLLSGGILYFAGIILTFTQPIQDLASKETLAWIILILSILTIYRVAQRFSTNSTFIKEYYRYLPWIDSILLLIFITLITQVCTQSMTIDSQHLILTTVWTLYAIIAMIIGFALKQRSIRIAGLTFLFVTLIKLIFIDFPDVSLAIRAILFIGLGTIGVVLSRFFYKK